MKKSAGDEADKDETSDGRRRRRRAAAQMARNERKNGATAHYRMVAVNGPTQHPYVAGGVSYVCFPPARWRV